MLVKNGPRPTQHRKREQSRAPNVYVTEVRPHTQDRKRDQIRA